MRSNGATVPLMRSLAIPPSARAISHNITMDAICTANNQFGLDLVKQIHSNDNLILGQFSIMTALAMLYLGARKESATQIEKVLHLENIDNVHSAYKEVLAALKTSDDYILYIANRFFGEKSFFFFQTYLEDSKTYYGSELENFDFFTNPEFSRQHINAWVDEQTRGKIQELLPQNSISDATKLVVINAMYFLANWTLPFDYYGTYTSSFTLSNNQEVTVEMMTTTSIYNYRNTNINGQKVQILELPYGETKDMSMIVFLPEHSTDLSELEQMISYETAADWTNSENMISTSVEVHLPRLKITSGVKLVKHLQDLGINDVFTTKANLSGIARQHLKVSGIYHKASVSVNEEGTEAVAATDIAVPSSAIFGKVTFKADHPFIFLIQHKVSKCNIFYGKCVSP
ncbi:leukocyte elastase inhibitor-like [Discoglossus pictus]